MAVIVQARSINLPSGRRQVTAENVPDALSRVVLSLRRCTTATPQHWDDVNTVLSATAWISIDGGPFVKCAGFSGSPGGIYLENGVEVPEFSWNFTLWPGVNRQIRFEIDVQNGPLRSEFDLVAF